MFHVLKHFLEVSGYREDLVGYGEDIDVAKRLYDHGLKFKGLNCHLPC